MNWKNAFFGALVIFFASTGWAIKLTNEKAPEKPAETQTPVDDKSTNEVHQNGMHPDAAFVVSCTGTDSGGEDEGSNDYGILDKDKATCRISRYQTLTSRYIEQINDYDYMPYGNSCYSVVANKYSVPYNSQVIKGFKINKPCELHALLNNAIDENNIYAYLALQLQENALGQYDGNGFSRAGNGTTTQILQLDLIFKAKSTPINDPGTGQPISTDVDGYYYYDFTTPCPPMCGSN